jgi:hypothetical protein
MTTAAEKRHLDKVSSQPCALCGAMPVEVHHILEGRIKGRKSGHWTAIPLCPCCHRDSSLGIHGRQDMLRIHKVTELELLGQTLERIYGAVR